ncbi:MAG: DMT family transporter, partial [Pseudomonadota bacterium]
MKMTINEWFLLIFLSLLWGFSFVFAEFTLQIFQPFTVGFLRVALAGIALIAIAEFLKLAPLKTFAAHWRAFLILAFFNNFVPFTLIIWAQTVIEAGTAAILNASMPLFTLVLARFWRHEEALTVNKLCGILFGIAGVAV